MLSRYYQWIFGATIVAALIGLPLSYAHQREKLQRNFRVVEDGKLYRSAQLNPEGLGRVINDYGIKTAISFRYPSEPGQTPPDQWEVEFCKKLGVNHVHITPDVWSPDKEGVIPAQKGVDQFLKVMNDPRNQPALVHCFRGAHRTGIHCAIYRMEFNKWSNEEAISEMKALGYTNLDEEENIRTYLSQYTPSKSPPRKLGK